MLLMWRRLVGRLLDRHERDIVAAGGSAWHPDAERQGRPDLELVIELTPRWLRMHGVSAAHVIRHMHALGFNAYKLGDDYEISRCLPLGVPARPRRMKPGEPLGCDQADVIFSREEGAYL